MLPYNPFATPKDYDEMLDKIGWFTFFNLVIFFILISNYTSIFNHIPSILLNTSEAIGVSLIEVSLAVIVAIMLRIVKLHNVISNIFCIRKNFDLKKILIPLTEEVGIKLDNHVKNTLTENREKLMRKIFYAYASFEEPKIDLRLVRNALDSWSWAWICLEATFIWSLLFVTAISVNEYTMLIVSGAALLFLIWMFILMYRRSVRNVSYQLQEILSNKEWKKSISKELRNALQS